MPDGGVLDIETSNIIIDKSYVAEHPGAKAGTYVSISVRDTGTGISGGDLKRVFEPFFTTKEVGSGTGLGLSMVYGFAKQSGGHVTIESRVKEGTQVNLILPSTKTMEQRAVVENQTRPLQGSGESILLVEDEPAVRRLVSTILTGLGYRITVAADSEEALTLLTGIESLDLLLSDVVLPGKLSGRDLAVIVEQKRPQTKILLMSGYASELVEEEGELGSAYELLRKPFRKADLARKVRSILDSHSLHTRREATRPPSDSSFGGPPPP
jgi:CheY-like chemotaxis protein